MVLVEAPNSRAISVASLESSVWLMVARMLRSINFLMTMLALTSSFSESSLTVIPSVTVISRLTGGGPEAVWRRVEGRRILSSGSALRSAALIAGAALLIGRRRRDGGFHAGTARCGMHRTRPAAWAHGNAWADTRTRAL